MSKPKAAIDGIYSTSQIGAICSVGARTVAKWIDSGRLIGHRLPGSPDRRVTRADLERFLEANGIPLERLYIVRTKARK